jgi:hypothetical protein
MARIKRSEKSSERRSLNRLVAAVGLYARQQWERIAAGDAEEYDDVLRENRELIGDILPKIEQALDEDAIDELENEEFAWNPMSPGFWVPPEPHASPRGRGFNPWNPMTWMMPPPMPRLPGPPGPYHRQTALDDALADFRDTFQAHVRKARRAGHAMSEADIDGLLKELKADLTAVARRGKGA